MNLNKVNEVLMTRRDFLRFGALSTAAVALAACGASRPTSEAGKVAPAVIKLGPVERSGFKRYEPASVLDLGKISSGEHLVVVSPGSVFSLGQGPRSILMDSLPIVATAELDQNSDVPWFVLEKEEIRSYVNFPWDSDIPGLLDYAISQNPHIQLPFRGVAYRVEYTEEVDADGRPIIEVTLGALFYDGNSPDTYQFIPRLQGRYSVIYDGSRLGTSLLGEIEDLSQK